MLQGQMHVNSAVREACVSILSFFMPLCLPDQNTIACFVSMLARPVI